METRKNRMTSIASVFLGITLIALTGLIGEPGMAYLSAAIECYLLVSFLLITCVPNQVERMVRSRLSKNQYKNAGKVLKVVLIYSIAGGLLGTALLELIAGAFLEHVLRMPEAVLTLRLLAPAILITSLSAAIKGYFQGMGTAMPSVISGFLLQLFSLTFALLFGNILSGYGEKVAGLLKNEHMIYLYGAAGAAGGILLASILEFLFLLLLYLGAGRRMSKRQKEGLRLTEDGTEVFGQFMGMMMPAALVLFLGRLGTILGQIIYQKHGLDDLNALTYYGSFYGRYLILSWVVVIVVMAAAAGSETTVVTAYKKEEYKNAKSHLGGGIQFVFLFVSIIVAILTALAPEFGTIFFGDVTDVSVTCMRIGFLLPITLSLGIYFARILWGIGKQRYVLVSVLIALLVMVVVTVAGLAIVTSDPGGMAVVVDKKSIYVLVWAQIAFGLVFCLICGALLLRIIKSNPDWLRCFVFPGVAATGSGIIVFLLARALTAFSGEIMALIVGTFVGLLFFLILLFASKCIRDKDLYVMPCGPVLRKLGRLLHMLDE